MRKLYRMTLFCFISALFAANLHAAVFNVTNTLDSGAGSLRDIIAQANINGQTDTITFATGGNSITVHSRIDVTSPLTIDGGLTQVIGSTGTDILWFNSGSEGSAVRDCAFVDATNAVVFLANSLQLTGCRLGTDWVDTTGRGNTTGIYVSGSDCTIGGTLAGQRNVVCNNSAYGVVALGATRLTVIGNFIGTDSLGILDRGNGDVGVLLTQGAVACRVGGDFIAGEGNVISGNFNYGVRIRNAESFGNTVCGNIIGLNWNQSGEIPNGMGVAFDRAQGNFIGLPEVNKGNIIAGNNSHGIYAPSTVPRTAWNVIQNNFIGLSASGVNYPNDRGVYLVNADANQIGGFRNPSHRERNVISGNSSYGVYLQGHGNTVSGNYIGTNPAGNAAIGNGDDGFYLYGNSNLVGGDNINLSNLRGNLISGQSTPYSGLSINGGQGNTIAGNWIGLNAAGNAALPNQYGFYMAAAAHHNFIGGTTDAQRNVISGNILHGLYYYQTHDNKISGNYFGLNADGTASIQNGNSQIFLNAANNNQFGGFLPGERNYICGGLHGIRLYTNSSSNVVFNNWLGLLPNHSPAPAAFTEGIFIEQGANLNIIGVPYTGLGNLITGGSYGIQLVGANTDFNSFYGNTITSFTTLGISLGSSSNNDKTPPLILVADMGLVSGTAQAQDYVEVFKSEPGAGPGGSLSYVGGTIADLSGNWSLFPSGLAGGDYACALATDVSGNTSEFAGNVLVTELIPTITPTYTSTATLTATVTPTRTVTPTMSPAPEPDTPTATPTMIVSPLTLGETGIRAYPNPGKDLIRFAVNLGEAGSLRIEIYNLAGERIATLENQVTGAAAIVDWSCADIAPGVYLARVLLNGRELQKLKIAVAR